MIEIDAASNRGINEMREIRENVRYRPARDRYKVFIVDEAHQITKEAFNALLKTLEEPPEWVVFILCTTEANEIPNTIASRCQHFTFRSVDFTEMIERHEVHREQEGIEASEEVLSVIAQAGEGSVRDSLSALDQAIACCGNTLNVEDIRALLGCSELIRCTPLPSVHRSGWRAHAGNRAGAGAQRPKSAAFLPRAVPLLAQSCWWPRSAGKPTRLIAASEREQQALLKTAGLFSEEDLTRYLNLTLDLYKALQTSLQPRLHLELGLDQAGAGRQVAVRSKKRWRDFGNPQPACAQHANTGAAPISAATLAGSSRGQPPSRRRPT